MGKPTVAVIAIHGVGDHEAGSTAGIVASQLQHFFPEDFGSFECSPLHLSVDTKPLRISADSAGTSPSKDQALPHSVRARATAAVPGSGSDWGDIAFTSITLAGGENYTGSYSTARMRHEEQGRDGFDLYEMFWTDLSHGGTKGGLTVLRQMMQLFLHVACLGRTALGTLLASLGQKQPGGAVSQVYTASAWGYWILAVPIALGNLMLLCLGVAFLGLLVPDKVPGRVGTAIVVGILAATLLGSAWRRLMRKENAPRLLERIGLPLVGLVALSIPAALGIAWTEKSPVPAPDVAFLLALAISLVLGTTVVRRYEVSRPGAMTCWWSILAVCSLWGMARAAVMWISGTPLGWLKGLVFLVEGAFGWLVLAWAALAVVNLWLLAAGVRAKRQYPNDDAVRRSVDTGLVAAAVPAPLLLIVVLTMWSAFWNTLNRVHFDLMQAPVSMLFVPAKTVSDLIEQLILLSANPAAVPSLLCLTLALACVVLAVVPSILAELFPRGGSAEGAGSHALRAARSLALWRWLNQGFGMLHSAKWIAVSAFFILLPAGGLLQYLNIKIKLPDLGVAIGGSAVVFIAATRLFGAAPLGKLSRTFARLRVMIDTAIDVDNWLRERPEGQTPRLRIMARYVSLLHHLQQQGYRRLLVVSHSQGTVITVDLLRYLRAKNPEFLKQLGPIDLLTFGSPLRQLYAERFPALYGWAAKLSHKEALEQAGLTNWWNGYGSGDYVGRNLWGGTGSAQPWQPGQAEGRLEFCTGALAHTHYFDEYSPDVAAAVRDAIVNAGDAIRLSKAA